MRGLAALYVMLGHARWLLWEGMEGFQTHAAGASAPLRALVLGSAALRYGHEAVLFFFVLSGFVIHLRYARRLHADPQGAQFGYGAYLWRRTRRLFPPLLGAMALTAALDAAGTARGYGIYASATPYALINTNILPVHDFATGLGNLAFLMTTVVPYWGSDGPLWSLHYEWWFYMVYPLLWLLGRRSPAVPAAVVGLLWGSALLAERHGGLPPAGFWFTAFFAALFPWWLGAVLAEIHAGRLPWPWARLALLAALLLVLPVAGERLGPLRPLAWALGFAGLIAGCFALEERGWSLRALARLRGLGDFSYTLYVTHFPILVLLAGWTMSRTPGGRLPQDFGLAAAGALLTLGFAWAAHFALERPFLSAARARHAA